MGGGAWQNAFSSNIVSVTYVTKRPCFDVTAKAEGCAHEICKRYGVGTVESKPTRFSLSKTSTSFEWKAYCKNSAYNPEKGVTPFGRQRALAKAHKARKLGAMAGILVSKVCDNEQYLPDPEDRLESCVKRCCDPLEAEGPLESSQLENACAQRCVEEHFAGSEDEDAAPPLPQPCGNTEDDYCCLTPGCAAGSYEANACAFGLFPTMSSFRISEPNAKGFAGNQCNPGPAWTQARPPCRGPLDNHLMCTTCRNEQFDNVYNRVCSRPLDQIS